MQSRGLKLFLFSAIVLATLLSHASADPRQGNPAPRPSNDMLTVVHSSGVRISDIQSVKLVRINTNMNKADFNFAVEIQALAAMVRCPSSNQPQIVTIELKATRDKNDQPIVTVNLGELSPINQIVDACADEGPKPVIVTIPLAAQCAIAGHGDPKSGGRVTFLLPGLAKSRIPIIVSCNKDWSKARVTVQKGGWDGTF